MWEDDNFAQGEGGIGLESSGDDGLALVGHGCPKFREPTFRPAPQFLRLQTSTTNAPKSSNPGARRSRLPSGGSAPKLRDAIFVPGRRRENRASLHERWASDARLSSSAEPGGTISSRARRARRRYRGGEPCLRRPRD